MVTTWTVLQLPGILWTDKRREEIVSFLKRAYTLLRSFYVVKCTSFHSIFFCVCTFLIFHVLLHIFPPAFNIKIGCLLQPKLQNSLLSTFWAILWSNLIFARFFEIAITWRLAPHKTSNKIHTCWIKEVRKHPSLGVSSVFNLSWNVSQVVMVPS